MKKALENQKAVRTFLVSCEARKPLGGTEIGIEWNAGMTLR